MESIASAAGANPGFLDTLTWDLPRAAAATRASLYDGRFDSLAAMVARGDVAAGPALRRRLLAASKPPLTFLPDSAVAGPAGLSLLAQLEDGQRVFLSLSRNRSPLATREHDLCTVKLGAARLEVVPCDLPHLRRFLEVAPEFAPVVPTRPGLGIGCRMGVLDMPVALEVVRRFDLCASVMQSSVYRELAPLADLQSFPIPQIELPGVGRVPLGHTGMSITGQFVAMIAERIALGDRTPMVADADHLPLRGLKADARRLAKRLVREAGDRTLFTLDPHFCLYGGDARLQAAAAAGAGLSTAFARRFSAGQRRDLLARYAERPFRVPDGKGGRDHAITLSRGQVEDCALRFADPLDALEEACDEIQRVRAGRPVAVEVSIDEVPGLSEPHHFYYLAAELHRRKLPVFSLAPGLGFSKLDVDVVDPEGSFATRVRILEAIARRFGTVMGIHSGDGKSVRTRRVLAGATGGNFWYKVSPDRQRTFFRSLALCPAGSAGQRLFRDVYRVALDRVLDLALRAEGETAAVARKTLEVVLQGRGLSGAIAKEVRRVLAAPPSAAGRVAAALEALVLAAPARQVPGDLDDHILHDYAFATVGARDRRGRFLNRGRFFTLPAEALAVYQRLDKAYLTDLVRSLGMAG